MSRNFFGTDGIRGKANLEPVTPERLLSMAMATAAVLRRGDHRHAVVIGKDTRLSGYMLEPALTAGFISMGMDVILLGPLPTPAIGMLTRSLRADLGVVISASHNPFDDNGVKLFGPDGFKLSDEVEAEIEAVMAGDVASHRATAGELGRAKRLDDASGRYIEFVKQSFPRHLRLDGLKVVVDCAHGAAYKVAPKVLYELGAEVVPLSVAPDGLNINRDCGATAPQAMAEAVVAAGADLGLALDGDADRVVIADEQGRIVDGDQIMALIAQTWSATTQLKGGAVVATVMSNLGLERYLEDRGIDLVRTPVGDRYVVEEMRARGCNIGGEQSGHIVLSDHSTTGDGLIAALQVLAVLVERQQPASEVLRVFDPFPQRLRNVRGTGAAALQSEPVRRAVLSAEAELGGDGRLLIRPSGTEPVIRVMAEGPDPARVDAIVDRLCRTLEEASR